MHKHTSFLKSLPWTFWAGKYPRRAVLRKSACHELTPCSKAGSVTAETEGEHGSHSSCRHRLVPAVAWPFPRSWFCDCVWDSEAVGGRVAAEDSCKRMNLACSE